jgi:hypothetical protein
MTIIDVDFRWVMREKDTHGEHFQCPPLERVLQWRKKVLDPSKSANPTWTEWQDVRTEEE